MMLYFAVGAQRHLADGKFARIVATERLSVGDVAGVERRIAGNLIRRAGTQQASDAPVDRFDLGLQDGRNVAPYRRDLPGPRRIASEIQFGSQSSYGIVDGLDQCDDRVGCAPPEIGLDERAAAPIPRPPILPRSIIDAGRSIHGSTPPVRPPGGQRRSEVSASRAAAQLTAIQLPSGLRQAVPRATCGRPSM